MGIFQRLFGKQKTATMQAGYPSAVREQDLDPEMQELIELEQAELVFKALTYLAPPLWERISLEVTGPGDGFGQNLIHTISSPDGHIDVVTPDYQLLEATRSFATQGPKPQSRLQKASFQATRKGSAWDTDSTCTWQD